MRPAVSSSETTPVAFSFSASPFAVAWSARSETDFMDETSDIAASSCPACAVTSTSSPLIVPEAWKPFRRSPIGRRETSTSAHADAPESMRPRCRPRPAPDRKPVPPALRSASAATTEDSLPAMTRCLLANAIAPCSWFDEVVVLLSGRRK